MVAAVALPTRLSPGIGPVTCALCLAVAVAVSAHLGWLLTCQGPVLCSLPQDDLSWDGWYLRLTSHRPGLPGRPPAFTELRRDTESASTLQVTVSQPLVGGAAEAGVRVLSQGWQVAGVTELGPPNGPLVAETVADAVPDLYEICREDSFLHTGAACARMPRFVDQTKKLMRGNILQIPCPESKPKQRGQHFCGQLQSLVIIVYLKGGMFRGENPKFGNGQKEKHHLSTVQSQRST